MKTIGLIGGMSWESTLPYYRVVNESVKSRLGGLHSAKIILYSVDFHEIEGFQHAGDWESAGALLANAARALEAAGADFLVLCTNTMHRVAPEIESAVRIPLLHIADATSEEIKNTPASHAWVSWALNSPWNNRSTRTVSVSSMDWRSSYLNNLTEKSFIASFTRSSVLGK